MRFGYQINKCSPSSFQGLGDIPELEPIPRNNQLQIKPPKLFLETNVDKYMERYPKERYSMERYPRISESPQLFGFTESRKSHNSFSVIQGEYIIMKINQLLQLNYF